MPSQQIPTLNPYNSAGIVDPLANAQRGALAFAYGVPQMEMDQRDQELAYNRNNLQYGQEQQDVPLKDIERQVKMGDADIKKQLQDQGIAKDQAMQEALAKTESSKAQQEQARLTQDISRGQSMQAAIDEIDGLEKRFGPPGIAWAGAWDEMKQRYAARGIPLPPQPDVNGVDMFRNRANAVKNMLPQWQDRESKLAVVAAQNKGSLDVAKTHAGATVEAAGLAAGAARDYRMASMDPNRRTLLEIDQDLKSGKPLTEDMIRAAFSTTDKNTEVNETVKTETAALRTLLEGTPRKDTERRAEQIAKFGIPATYASKTDGEIVQYLGDKIRKEQVQNFAKNKYAEAIAKGQYDSSTAKLLGLPPPKQTEPAQGQPQVGAKPAAVATAKTPTLPTKPPSFDGQTSINKVTGERFVAKGGKWVPVGSGETAAAAPKPTTPIAEAQIPDRMSAYLNPDAAKQRQQADELRMLQDQNELSTRGY